MMRNQKERRKKKAIKMMLMVHLDNLTNLIIVQHVSSDSDAMSEFHFNWSPRHPQEYFVVCIG